LGDMVADRTVGKEGPPTLLEQFNKFAKHKFNTCKVEISEEGRCTCGLDGLREALERDEKRRPALETVARLVLDAAQHEGLPDKDAPPELREAIKVIRETNAFTTYKKGVQDDS